MITAARILEIITKYGVSATLRSWPSKSYDVTTGVTTLGAAADQTVIIVPPYGPGAGMERYGPIDGNVDVEAQTCLSSSGVTTAPAVGMQVIWDSRTWAIVGVNRVSTQDGVVMYELALTGRPA